MAPNFPSVSQLTFVVPTSEPFTLDLLRRVLSAHEL